MAIWVDVVKNLASVSPYLIPASWPKPPSVFAFHTTRWGGVSCGVYATWNLGFHVGDEARWVAQNRALLMARVRAISPCDRGLAFQWLNQVHGIELVSLPRPSLNGSENCLDSSSRVVGGDIDDAAPQADGVFLRQPGTAAVVLTADCLPLVLADRSGGAIAVVHAGWRGLAAGILETALAAFQVPADEIVVTLGPCILPRNFEVGADVRATFLHRFGREAATAFLPRSGGRWYGMLARLAYLRLKALGVSCVVGFGVTQAQSLLSHCNPFYSYRAAQTTGRFATVVGIFDA